MSRPRPSPKGSRRVQYTVKFSVNGNKRRISVGTGTFLSSHRCLCHLPHLVFGRKTPDSSWTLRPSRTFVGHMYAPSLSPSWSSPSTGGRRRTREEGGGGVSVVACLSRSRGRETGEGGLTSSSRPLQRVRHGRRSLGVWGGHKVDVTEV